MNSFLRGFCVHAGESFSQEKPIALSHVVHVFSSVRRIAPTWRASSIAEDIQAGKPLLIGGARLVFRRGNFVHATAEVGDTIKKSNY